MYKFDSLFRHQQKATETLISPTNVVYACMYNFFSLLWCMYACIIFYILQR